MQGAVALDGATIASSVPCAVSARPDLDSHHSHHPSGCEEEVSQSSLPVECFQRKPVGRGRVDQLKRKADSAGFSPCSSALDVLQGLPSITAKRRPSAELQAALCENGIVGTPPRDSGDVTVYSSSSAFQGSDNKGSCSESEHFGSRATFGKRGLKEGTCSGSSSRGSRLKNGLEKKRKPRVPIQGPFSARASAPLDTSPRPDGDFCLEGKGSVNVSEQGSGNLPYLTANQVLGGAQPLPAAGHARLSRKKSANHRQRTSCFMGVGSSNRKNQWQARILVHGKVTHLGYYETEEEAARVYDRVAIALNGPGTQTNFPASQYSSIGLAEFRGLGREDLQRALGVKPMDKSSQFRGVSRKKGKWEAKVMVNRKWAFRALYDNEDEAARAYDNAVRRLKPNEASSYVNFKDHTGARRTPATKVRKSGHRSRAHEAGYWGAPSPLVTQPVLELQSLPGPGTPSCRNATLEFPTSAGLPCTLQGAPLSLPVSLEAVKTAQLEQDDLVSCSRAATLADLSPQHSALHSRPSFNQLPPLQRQLSGMPLMPLPDPNSIGVPPPSYDLPFPELVTSSAETLQQQQQLGHSHSVLPDVLPSVMPGSGLVMPAAVDLPQIPPPLLPAEASRLSRALSTSSMAPTSARDICSTPRNREQPNPFQDASASLPPPLVTVPSSSALGFTQDATRQMSTMASQGSAALSRAASDSILRGVEGLHNSAQQVDTPYGAQASGMGCMSSLPLPTGPVTRTFRAMPAPIPPSVFSDYPAPQRQGSFTPASASVLPRAASAVSSLTAASDMMSATLTASSRQLSAPSHMMLPHELPPYGEAQGVSMSLPFSAASAAFASLAPAGVMDPLGLGKPVEADMPVMNREDAAEIMAQLGVNVLEPDCHSPLQAVQIGGEDLGMFTGP